MWSFPALSTPLVHPIDGHSMAESLALACLRAWHARRKDNECAERTARAHTTLFTRPAVLMAART